MIVGALEEVVSVKNVI